jgi:hypothetical protein
MSEQIMHERARDEIRLRSGEVIVCEPIAQWDVTHAPKEVLELAERIRLTVGEVGSGYIVVLAYQRIDSVYDRGPVVVFLDHITSIRPLSVQIRAGADAFK